jgi:hypothetical protein
MLTYVVVIVDLTTGKYYRYSGDGYGKAASVSLQGNYIFAGKSLYMLIQPDITKEPRLRFHGTYEYHTNLNNPWELNSTFVIKAPEGKPYKPYFDSGEIKVTFVHAEKRPVMLVNDPDVKQGKIGNMLDKGLVGSGKVYLRGAEIKDEKLLKLDEHTIRYERKHIYKNVVYLAPLFGQSIADSGVFITIPVETKLTVYSELYIKPAIGIVHEAPVFDWKGELLGVTGLKVITDAGAGAATLVASGKAMDWLADLLAKRGYDELAIRQAETLAQSALKSGAVRLVGKAVGALMVVDAGLELYSHYENLKPYTSMKGTVYIIPVLVDVETGNKYAIAKYYLPLEASDKKDDFVNHAKTYMVDGLGIPEANVRIRVDYLADTWANYTKLIKEGVIKDVDLLALAKDLIPEVPPDRLRIEKIVIVVDFITSGYSSLFDYLGGGFELPVATVVHGQNIEVYGTTYEAEYTNPEDIVQVIPKVEINGVSYDLHAAKDGAVAQFSLPVATDTVSIKFPGAENMKAKFDVSLKGHITVPMEKKNGFILHRLDCAHVNIIIHL